jgi:hypothetical protein
MFGPISLTLMQFILHRGKASSVTFEMNFMFHVFRDRMKEMDVVKWNKKTIKEVPCGVWDRKMAPLHFFHGFWKKRQESSHFAIRNIRIVRSSMAPRCARRAIAEAKQRSQRSVIGWVTKIYYLELLRAFEGTLSRWSRLHLQSLVPTPVQGGLMSGRRPVVKSIAESLS